MVVQKLNQHRFIGFNDTWLMILGIPLCSFIMSAILFGNDLWDNSFQFFVTCASTSLLYTAIFWLVIRQSICWFRSQYKGEQASLKRVMIQSVLVLALYLLIKAVIGFALRPLLGDNDTAHEWAFDNFLASLLITFLIVMIYEVVYFNSFVRQSQLEKEQLAKEHIHSQLEGLRNQVNPHFLFNSLNTLAHLIQEDTQRATNFVERLSRVYRYILDIRDERLIPLSEELQFLEAYIHLLEDRFGSNIDIQVNISTKTRMMIVPFALQILLENAIKHNEISSAKPLYIKMNLSETGKIIVQNNLQKKKQVVHSTGVGLQNIKKRYAFVTDESVEVIQTADHFVVALPVIQEVSLQYA